MEIVSAGAAIGQLLGEAILLVQQIRQARDSVRNAPKRLKDSNKDLDDLLNTLYLIQQEKNLQTTAVDDQVRAVYLVAVDVLEFITRLEQGTRKSVARQYLHALRYSKEEQQRLDILLKRLSAAKDDLATRILLVQVHLTGRLGDGMTAALPLISRTDENVQQVLEGQVSSIVRDRGQYPGTPEVDFETRNSSEEPCSNNRNESTNSGYVYSSYLGNQVSGQAQMINGNVGSVPLAKGIQTQHRSNKASGRSLQVNGAMDPGSFEALLASRN